MSQLSEQLTHCRLSYSIDLFTHSLTHSHTHTLTLTISPIQDPEDTSTRHCHLNGYRVLATIQFDDDDAMVLALKRAVGCVHRRMGMGVGMGVGV